MSEGEEKAVDALDAEVSKYTSLAVASGAQTLSMSSDDALIGELLRRMEVKGIFNRDPNAPRPILDAIKKAIADFIEQLAPQLQGQLGPLLLQLLIKLLTGGASA